MQRLLTARVRIHTQHQTGDATVVWPQYPGILETLMLAIILYTCGLGWFETIWFLSTFTMSVSDNTNTSGVCQQNKETW